LFQSHFRKADGWRRFQARRGAARARRIEGCRVFDVDGNEHIDCINNLTSLIHGRAHPVLVEAAARQLALGSAFGLPTRSEVELAELLASRLPSVEQVRFTNSGTEAVMIGRSAATGRPT
jgi:glutamate-1-semialdehyde 2,1-aminomutase